MSKYGIQKGWSDVIHIGRLNKVQTLFLDDKEDHTNRAINAVLELIHSKYDDEMEFTTGKKRYRVSLTVEDMEPEDSYNDKEEHNGVPGLQ